MSKSLTWDCPQCKSPVTSTVEDHLQQAQLHCPKCEHTINDIRLDNNFEKCGVCPGSQFYTQKDFNRGLGCLLVLIGICLVPLTYGLSLPVVALVDWFLYRRTPAMIICYRCGTEYRGFHIPKRFKPYKHHIGLRYDKYR